MEKLLELFDGRIGLAKALDVTPSYISMVTKGKRKFSVALVKKAVEKSGGVVSKHDLRPDIYQLDECA